MSTRRAPFVAFFALAAASACSLLTSLDGLSDGDPDAGRGVEGSGIDGAVPGDGGADTAPPPGDGGDPGDAGERSRLYALAVLSDDPRGYWRLDESSGTLAKDEKGAYPGAYVAAPTLGEPGVAGSRAMKITSGSQAHMRVASSAFRYTGVAPYTAELWAKVGELKNYQWAAGTELGGAGVRNGWSLLSDANGDILYEVWRTEEAGAPMQVRGLSLTRSALPSGGAFRHIVMTYTGTHVIGYIDGVGNNPFPTTGMVPDTGELVWGCRGDQGSCLDGWTLDELAVYDVALTAERVKAHYDLGK